MKTKKEREQDSKKRQELGKRIRVWMQKVRDLEPHPERKAELDFAKLELRNCKETMWNLNVAEKRQRAWADGRQKCVNH
jgi:hypothetical protein